MIPIAMDTPYKINASFVNSRSWAYSLFMVVSIVVFICKIVITLPTEINIAAGKSYLGISFSFSIIIDRITVISMAAEQVVVNKVISANGSMNT